MKKSTIKMALRNLTRQKRRSFMLALAIGFGFFVVTAIDGLAGGAVDCLEDQICQMNGGNVLIQGVEHIVDEDGNIKKENNPIIRDRKFVEDLVKENVKDYEYYSCRTSSSGSLIFNNKKIVSQVWGVDFEKEDFLLNSLMIVKGDVKDVFQPNSVILNDKMADTLKADIGDVLLYSTTTLNGQRNVGELKVALITKDPSLMASAMVYAPIDYINEVCQNPEGSYNNFSISLKDKSKQNQVAQTLENAIRNQGKIVTSRMEAYKTSPKAPTTGLKKQINSNLTTEPIYISFSLADAIPALQTVVGIVHLVSTIILVVILLIVMVGISNTYRMILYERIKEIGTMRAVGMTGKQSGQLFTTEAVILSILGAFAGLLLSILVMFVVSRFNITNEALSFFLSKGHLTWKLSASSIIIKYVLMIVLTILAVRSTSKKVSKMWPAQALR